MSSEPISWEEFKKGILAQFFQKKKVWDECLRDAERYRGESFEECDVSQRICHSP